LSAALFVQAQEPSTAPPVKTPEPAGGAGNGPRPGPAQAAPGTAQRGGAAAQNPKASDFGQKFFGLAAPPDPAAVARGQKTFVANCAFCHGSNANGGNSGPNLVRSVLVLHDEGTGSQIGPVILNGRTDKGMPKFAFSQEQIKDVAAFLLNRSQSTVNRMNYKTQNINTGDPKAGATFFAANCASCHSASGDLTGIANKYEPEALLSHILYPDVRSRGAEPNPKTQPTVTVTPSSGNAVTGRLTYLDDFTVSLVDGGGENRSWSRETPGLRIDVKDPLQAHADLLPKYTDADMHNVLAYLETLK
jgi:cytochrome c oxidase cbb3-type subunit III